MRVLPNFVSMAKSSAEIAEEKSEMVDYPQNLYPYGLCISLCEEELEKLDLDDSVDVGDMIHIHALGKVTSVNKRDTDQGTKIRVEIQMTDIALEDEDHENDDAEEALGRVDYRKLYQEAE